MARTLAGRLALPAVLGVALSATLAPQVAAQEAHDEPSPAVEDARARFEAGETAFEAEDFGAALSHFRAALELANRDGIRFNIAACLERLGRFREAAEEFRVASRSDQLSEESRARARSRQERARAQLGSLRLSGTASATAVVDGEAMCELPCELELDPTVHAVQVRGDGRTSPPERVELSAGGSFSLQLELPPAPAPVPGTTPSRTRGFSALAWVGVALVAAGAGGTVGFGLRTAELEREFARVPSRANFDEGTGMLVATNTSIGLAALGAVFFVIDLVMALQDVEGEAVSVGPRGVSAAF